MKCESIYTTLFVLQNNMFVHGQVSCNTSIIIPDLTFLWSRISEKRQGISTYILLSCSESLLVNCYIWITKSTSILLKPENFVLNNLRESWQVEEYEIRTFR